MTMTPDLLTLAASVVALPGWRWMPGMLAIRVEPPTYCSEGVDPAAFVGRAYRVLDVSQERDAVRCNGERFRATSRDFGPDLTDAATGGCMLAMLGWCKVLAGATGALVESFEMDSLMWAPDQRGATLAEACARVALARGRWA